MCGVCGGGVVGGEVGEGESEGEGGGVCVCCVYVCMIVQFTVMHISL